MIDDLSPAAVVRRLDRGQQVVIPSSIRHSLLLMLPVLVIGIGLLAFFILVVHATIEDGRSPWLIIINLRMWALAVGTIGCLVVAPIGLFVRMRRRESLVLSPVGVASARRDQVLSDTLLPWQDIETIVFEKAARRGPKVPAYILTEEASRRRLGRGHNPRLLVKSGLVLSPRRLFPVLSAAHSRFARHIHELR
ncbi:hypothetical protein SAMN04489752_2701 [Brevibacterium siliguriense]|uniref:Uncharacterized protein n=1 Tax=Brevibacterium siliguriense TaxID=1136497 RepID=A0A1H1VM52_9MICO|nr:hypothetical protein [Brevibacterium siliguriense]SDS86004.1 hypothetical protein SAMN04489752_2701 [Brevibacterium siliguriense]